jgi:hypothetical protein
LTSFGDNGPGKAAQDAGGPARHFFYWGGHKVSWTARDRSPFMENRRPNGAAEERCRR